MGVSSSEMEAVDDSRRRTAQLPRGQYSTGIFPTIYTAVDPIAVKATKSPHSTETRSNALT